jgi:hypothetical protein
LRTSYHFRINRFRRLTADFFLFFRTFFAVFTHFAVLSLNKILKKSRLFYLIFAYFVKLSVNFWRIWAVFCVSIRLFRQWNIFLEKERDFMLESFSVDWARGLLDNRHHLLYN